MRQIYRKTHMPKCDFNKVALQFYWNCTSAWVFSCKFAAYFQNTFPQEHLWTAASVLLGFFIGNFERISLSTRKYRLGIFRYYYLTIYCSKLRLYIKPGIQERGTECGECGNGGRGGGGWCYIPGNVAKHSGERPQTLRGMSPNILGNVLKHSGECPQTFQGKSSNIPGNIAKYFGECPQTFQGMSPNIPVNVAKHSRECPKTSQGMSPNIPGNVAKHFRECR